jgi:hypothetical protein
VWIEVVHAGRSTCGHVENRGGGSVGNSGRPWMVSETPRSVHRSARLSPWLSPGSELFLGVDGTVRIALPSDGALLCTSCGQPVESAWTRVWIPCGSAVGGVWRESASSLVRDPVALWANYPHHGETSLCTNNFRDFCEARVRRFAASPTYGASDGPKTTKGRPQCVDAPKALRDKGSAIGGRAA